jgi:hypothetical protein
MNEEDCIVELEALPGLLQNPDDRRQLFQGAFQPFAWILMILFLYLNNFNWNWLIHSEPKN